MAIPRHRIFGMALTQYFAGTSWQVDVATAIKELVAHGVNYRKQVSPSLDALLPEEHFRLLAATMYHPRLLASQVPLREQGPGA